jgi:hypothetical protein
MPDYIFEIVGGDVEALRKEIEDYAGQINAAVKKKVAIRVAKFSARVLRNPSVKNELELQITHVGYGSMGLTARMLFPTLNKTFDAIVARDWQPHKGNIKISRRAGFFKNEKVDVL